MKVLFFIDSLTSGGKERRLIEIMKGLKSKTTIEFELVQMSKITHYKEIYDMGVKIHYVVRKVKKDISVFKTFYKICKDFKPDFVHCWDTMTPIYLAPICKLLGIKLINGMITDAIVRQNLLETNWRRGQIIFPFCDLVIGNSMAGLAAYRAPRSKSICIYNGFDFKRLDKMAPPDTVRNKFNIKAKHVVLMVGAFRLRKDYDTYVEAAMAICAERDDVEFLAVGEGENLERISKKVEAFSDKIKLVGAQQDVESIINISDICVLCSNSAEHGEGISNSILEYMALAKPVIASISGGTQEIVDDNKTGYIINPGSPQELIEKLKLLLDNSELRKKMGAAGLERIKKDFEINIMIDKYISVYKELKLAKKRKKNAVFHF